MKKTSPIYRFLAAVTALMVFASISLPVSLQAHGQMADFCPLEMNRDHEAPAPISADHCDTSTPYEFDTNESNTTNCDFSFACACSIDKVPIRAEATPSTAKAKVILSATVIGFTTELQPVQTQRKVPVPNLNSSPPPVFLVNSTFLN